MPLEPAVSLRYLLEALTQALVYYLFVSFF